MKKRNLLTPITNAILAFLIGLSGAACLCTAMELEASAGELVFVCAFFAAVTAFAPCIKRGWLAIPAAVALGVLYFWKNDGLQSLLYLVNRVSRYYTMAYGWSMPDFITNAPACGVTLGLMILGGVCTLLAGLSLFNRRIFGLLLAAALPLVPCFVVIDTVPSTFWLMAWLLALVVVLMSHGVRRVDPNRAGRVVAYLLIPLLLCCWLLATQVPRDTYERPSQEENFEDRLLEYVDKLPFVKVEDGQIQMDENILSTFTMPQITMPQITMPQITMPQITMPQVTMPQITMPQVTLDPGILDIFKDSVSLENAGPRDPGSNKVMKISTGYRGTLYLRERSYDVYTGTSWGTSGAPQTLDEDEKTLYRFKSKTVRIVTNWTHENFFLPQYLYADGQGADLEEGKLSNPDGLTDYSFEFRYADSKWKTHWMTNYGTTLGQLEDRGDTELPEQTLAQARVILEQLGITEDTVLLEAVSMIKYHVSTSATYDLNTQAMPEEYDDFAMWFLAQSDTGYCVHFATAATVLLRAAGIPARYVEGYMVSVEKKDTNVLSSDAHAWVEYYVPGIGWMILEATPGSSGEQPPTTEPTAPTTEPTAPTTEPTAPTTEPTAPTTEPTAPTTEPTAPTTEPTAPTTEPTAPTTEPTAPTTEPTAPTTEPTAPTTEPTAPATTDPGQTETEATVPSTTTPGELPEEPKDLTALWTALAATFAVLAAGCGLYGQWQLRLWLRKWWCGRGGTNRRAIKLWHHARLLAFLRRQKTPQALRDLAWKAKFSQHTITDQELQSFAAYRQRSIAHLQKRAWYLRLAYRFVFAIW